MSSGVRKKVEELLSPIEDMGYEIWNVEYVRDGKEMQLRIFADKEGGISLNDCETISRFISDKLDELDCFNEHYNLVVSSPGMDRALVKDEHFDRYKGEIVEVALYKGHEGRKKFSAILGEKENSLLNVTPVDSLTLKPESDEIQIPIELVSKVNLKIII